MMKYQRGLGFFASLFLALLLVGSLLLGGYLVYLNGIIRDKFEGQRWDIPAKVFARPLELQRDKPLSQADLIDELKLLNYKHVNQLSQSGQYVINGSQVFIRTRGFDFGDQKIAEQTLAIEIQQQRISRIRSSVESHNGKTYLEPVLIGGIYPQHNEDRVLLKLKDVPQPLIDALIATEDRNFYSHFGLSIRGTMRAILSNLTGGKRQGGSTLTQQLIKNFYLTSERTYKRKVNEAFMAVLLEMNYSKEEILEAYLNEVSLGQNGNYSINGYGLAAQFYFGRPLKELTIAQSAFLAGLVQGPSLYNPWKNPEKALKRRNIVLQNMLLQDAITQRQYDVEVRRPLGVLDKPALISARFPDFMDLVRRQLKSEYLIQDLEKQGLRIFTTLDPVAQMRIERSFKQSVQRLSPQLQGATIVSQPQTGEIVAAVGSTQSFTGFNRIVDTKRQVGSLLKPVIYLNALESERFTWASQIEDRAIRVNIGGNAWSPKNYNGGEYGTVPMLTALAQSYNLSAVQVANQFGLNQFVNQLYRLGISQNRSIPTNYPSIWLGAVELSPMDMLSLYQTFANAGVKNRVFAIRKVVNQNNEILKSFHVQPVPAINADLAYLLNFGLQEVVKSGTARAIQQQFSPHLHIAGKTGTTNNGRDAWFAGYTGNHVAVVWIGYDDNRVTGLTGSTGALPVWINVMKQLHHQPVEFPQPNTVVWRWINAANQLSSEHCGGRYIPMLVHTVPTEHASCAVSIDFDGAMPDTDESSFDFTSEEPTTPSSSTLLDEHYEQLR